MVLGLSSYLREMEVILRKTHDCQPTLNDSEVLNFCKNGFLSLESVVDPNINQMTLDYLNSGSQRSEPTDILDEDWFLDAVIKNPQAAGAIRSLLGKDFGLPILMSSHRTQTPQSSQDWHIDGNSKFGPQLNYLQVFYLPQECTREMGPTELIPGSHFMFTHRDAINSLGSVRNSYYAVAPAGSIIITHYAIWHRRSSSSVESIRENLKYNYWRSVEPNRDWLIDPDFDVNTADYTSQHPTYREQFRDAKDVAEMYLWLRGEHDKFRSVGGQGWPLPGTRNDIPYGIPKGIN